MTQEGHMTQGDEQVSGIKYQENKRWCLLHFGPREAFALLAKVSLMHQLTTISKLGASEALALVARVSLKHHDTSFALREGLTNAKVHHSLFILGFIETFAKASISSKVRVSLFVTVHVPTQNFARNLNSFLLTPFSSS